MTRFSNRILGPIAAAALAACSASPAGDAPVAEDDAVHARGIIGGKKASSYHEAVLVDVLRYGEVFGRCSGVLIAPSAVLTAGHCVHGFKRWRVTAPYAGGAIASSKRGATYDWDASDEEVDPDRHDIGVLSLTSPIALPTYPRVADVPLEPEARVVDVGRTRSGHASETDLFVGPPLRVETAEGLGFPFDYVSTEVIEPGDSGGPVFAKASGRHTVVALNSAGGEGLELLARVDLVRDWIMEHVEPTGEDAACDHDPCVKGTELDPACDADVAKVCTADDFCCTTEWDAACRDAMPTSRCGDG